MKRQLTAAAVSIALGLGMASSANAITIDPDGAGGNAAINVDALGWAAGNALATPAGGVVVPTPSGLIQIFGHGALSGFVDGAGNTVGGTGLNTAYEWTYVVGFREAAVAVGALNSNFFITPGGSNFFSIYYQAPRDANNLTGTGFNNGTLILSGSVLPFDPTTGSGSGTFQAAASNVQLDQFPNANPANNDYNGTGGSLNLRSTSGNGSTNFDALVQIGFANPDFFPGLASTILTVHTRTTIVSLSSSNSRRVASLMAWASPVAPDRIRTELLPQRA